MKTLVVSQSDIEKVVSSLNNDEVVSFPTETVYGIGVRYGSHKALDRLMEAKNRDYSKAITLMLNNKRDIETYAYINDQHLKIINKFMPGKITLILKRRESVDPYMTNGLDTIGIRIPDSDYVLNLIDRAGPLLVTSANISGSSNTTCTKDVLDQLDGRISLVVDGHTDSKVASTIIDMSKGALKILRLGDITREEIEEALE